MRYEMCMLKEYISPGNEDRSKLHGCGICLAAMSENAQGQDHSHHEDKCHTSSAEREYIYVDTTQRANSS